MMILFMDLVQPGSRAPATPSREVKPVVVLGLERFIHSWQIFLPSTRARAAVHTSPLTCIHIISRPALKVSHFLYCIKGRLGLPFNASDMNKLLKVLSKNI